MSASGCSSLRQRIHEPSIHACAALHGIPASCACRAHALLYTTYFDLTCSTHALLYTTYFDLTWTTGAALGCDRSMGLPKTSNISSLSHPCFSWNSTQCLHMCDKQLQKPWIRLQDPQQGISAPDMAPVRNTCNCCLFWLAWKLAHRSI